MGRQLIFGPGITPGTTITAVDTGTQTLTLSEAATADGTGVTLTSGGPVVVAFHPDGTSAGDPFPVDTNKSVGIAADGSGHVYVPNTIDHTVDEYDASTGALVDTLDPTVGGHGTFHGPNDVDVDAAGNVYVTDQSEVTADEIQTVDLHGATGGTYSLTLDGDTTGGTATVDIPGGAGTGDIADGSDTITNVDTTFGAFEAGYFLSRTGNRSFTQILR